MIKYINSAMAKKREALGKDEKGFTLIELLVVVLILGILAAIAIPVFIGQQQQAKDAEAQANLANAKVAIISYAVTNTTYPTDPAAHLVNYGWPQGGTPVTPVSGSITGGAATFCLSAAGGGSNVWYVTASTSVSLTACT